MWNKLVINIRNSELVATFKKLSNLLDQVLKLCLKGQSCKLYNDKYMIAPTEITNTEIFAFIAVLVLKLKLKCLFVDRQDNRNC